MKRKEISEFASIYWDSEKTKNFIYISIFTHISLICYNNDI